MKPKLNNRKWIAFKPELDTWLALASVLAMTGIYYFNTNYGFDHPFIFFFGFIFLGHLILNTALPAYVVLKMRGEGLEGLGIGRNWLLTSIFISAVLGASMYPSLKVALDGFDGDPLPNIAYNAIAFWEPLFVFGWLQLRFERAFGIIAGILMAALSFAAYHIGSFPMEGLIVLFLTGTFYGLVFAIVRNLVVLIPITWAIASTMGTIQGGFSFDWLTVGIYLGVLIMQIAILAHFVKKARIENDFHTAISTIPILEKA